MISAALQDRNACAPGREPKGLIKDAETVYANLEAVLLNVKRQTDASDFGPLSPRANRTSLKPKDKMAATFNRLFSEVDVLIGYLEDPRLTSDSKTSACT